MASLAQHCSRSRLALALLAVTMVGVTPGTPNRAHAADPAPQGQSGRYTMAPADGGFARLDTLTGAMSLCMPAGAEWTCQDMRDETARLRTENERLLAENKSLREENRRLEDTFLGPDKDKDGKPERDGDGARNFKLPSEQDVDRAFSYLQGMLKKFREKLDELEQSPPADKGTPL